MTAGAVALALGLLAPPAAAGGLIRDAEIERTLRTMTAPIFQAAGFRPDGIDLYIINDHTLNAFVANGNNMFLHTGLLQTLETPEELMAVIAHETGHLAGGHQARRQINIRNARGPALPGPLVVLAAAVAGGRGRARPPVRPRRQSADSRGRSPAAEARPGPRASPAASRRSSAPSGATTGARRRPPIRRRWIISPAPGSIRSGSRSCCGVSAARRSSTWAISIPSS